MPILPKKSPRVLPIDGSVADDGAPIDDAMERNLDELGAPFRAELGEERFRHYKRVFRKIDTDGSGTLDREELKAALRGASDLKSSSSKKISDEEIDRMMLQADADQSGEVDFPEFCAWNLTMIVLTPS